MKDLRSGRVNQNSVWFTCTTSRATQAQIQRAFCVILTSFLYPRKTTKKKIRTTTVPSLKRELKGFVSFHTRDEEFLMEDISSGVDFDRGKYQSIHRHRGGWMFLCVLIGFSNSRRYLLFISRHCSGFRAPFFSPYFWKELYATGCSLVSYILKQLFTFVSVEWLIFTSPLCGSANIHHYSPVLRWIIVNYYTRESTMAEDRLTNLPIRRVQLIHLK